MKIGYYFPRKNEISKSYCDKSDNSSIEWNSVLGCDFILSLFNNKNLDLPLFNENHDFSFSSLVDFQEFISIVKSIIIIKKIEYKIHPDWPDNIIPSLKKLEKLAVKNLVLKDQIKNLIESFSDNLSAIQKDINIPLEKKAKKLANLKDHEVENFDYISFIFSRIMSNYEQLEIPVYGFKFSDKIYGNSDFNKLIGYDHEKSNTLYTQFECLNKYYKVIRTDNRDDILWLTINRSTSGVYLKLVFRSNKIKKIDQYTHDKTDILYSKNDYVYFYRFFEKQNSLFLIASDKPVTANSINSESEQVTFGMMEVLDSDGKTLDAENIKRDQITKTLRRRDLLEGFKINHEFQWSNKNGDKIELYGLVPGFCGDVCKSCCKAPCICQKIIEWENGDRPTDIVSDFYNDSPFNF